MMVSDQELADRIVALGVGSSSPLENTMLYCIAAAFLRDDQFVRDWRVAGAMMEKVCHNKLMQIEQWDDSTEWAVDFGGMACADNESLPRAITEACVEALTQETLVPVPYHAD
jgi:hypothetical protein